MSITIQTTEMGTPLFLNLKRHASCYFKEKIRAARLALTDVSPAELLAEEATDGSTRGPDTRVLKALSRAAFEVDDYWRIVDVVHMRLARIDGKSWWGSYKALTLLEYLLVHGPESVSGEFRSEEDAIRRVGCFGYVDERGFNWGLAAKKKSERVLKLLDKGPTLWEERERARKLMRGIEGFGSCREELTRDENIVPVSSRFFAKANSLHNENCKVEVEGLLGDDDGHEEDHFFYRHVNRDGYEEAEYEDMECSLHESRPLI